MIGIMGRLYTAVIFLMCMGISHSQEELWEYCGNEPADLVFMLDASSSIWGPDFRRQLEFVRDVVSMFQIGENTTRVGVLTFSDHLDVHFNLKKFFDKQKMIKAILHVREGSGYSTATDLALKFSRTHLFHSQGGGREDVAKVAIVITDGKSRNSLKTLIEASRAKRDGIHLFAIGVGSEVNDKELTRMASEPASEYFFRVAGYNALDSLKNILAIKTCQVTNKPSPSTTTPQVRDVTSEELTSSSTTTEVPSTTTTEETTTLPTTTTTTTTTTSTTEDMRTESTTIPSTSTTTTITTTTTLPMSTTTSWLDVVSKECRSKMMDIVFALDTSDAVSYEDFWQVIRFVRDFARGLDIRSNATRIGVVLYSDQVQNGFDLDEHDNLLGLVSHLYKLDKSGGDGKNARPDEMIRYVRTKSFRRTVTRKGASQVVVVVTASSSGKLYSLKKQLKRATQQGLAFLAVGVGKNLNEEQLNLMAGVDEGPADTSNKLSAVHILPSHGLDNEAMQMMEELMLNDEMGPVSSTNPPSLPPPPAQPPRRSLFRLDKFTQLDGILLDAVLQACAAEVTVEDPLADQPCGSRQEADMMFVVDGANAGKKNTKKVMDFMKSLTNDMSIDDKAIQLGLVSPDPCAPQELFEPKHQQNSFHLKDHTDKGKLMHSLDTADTDDFSDLIHKMQKSGFRKEAGARKGAKRIAVLIVDGSLDNPVRALQEATRARNRGVEIYVIAVGSEPEQPELPQMCNYPTQTHFYHLNSYDELDGLKDTLTDILCDDL